MVCNIELLHVAPIFALVLVYFSGLSFKPKHLVASLVSIVGLASGSHMHGHHGTPFNIFDPCVVYSITFVGSIVYLVAKSFASKVAK
jgi:hypothetical protein